MNDRVKLSIQFEALLQHVTSVAEEIKDRSLGDGFCRIIYAADGCEYLADIRQLSTAKTVQQITEEKEADEEARLSAILDDERKAIDESPLPLTGQEPLPVDRFAFPVSAPVALPASSVVLAPAHTIDREAHPVPTDRAAEIAAIQEAEGGDPADIAKRFPGNRDDDKHVRQNGSD